MILPRKSLYSISTKKLSGEVKNQILSLSGSHLFRAKDKKVSVVFTNNEMNQFQIIVNILNKKPGRRSAEEIECLISGTESIKFFMDTNEEYGPETHQECCRYMTYCHLNKQEMLFEQGSIGFEFYIIITGSVGVFVWLDLNEKALSERKTKEFYSKFLDIKYPPQNGKYLTEVKVLSAGESFGELALLGGKSKPRSATIIAKDETHLCVLERTHFLKILKEKEEMKLYGNISFLSTFPFLNNVPFEIVKSIYLYCEVKSITFNRILYKEGENPFFFYMIKSGSFLIYKTRKIQSNSKKTISSPERKKPRILQEFNNFKKKNLKLSILGPNQFFGEIELLEKCQRRFSVVCKEQNSVVYMINKKDFFRKIAVEPSVIAFFMNHIAETKARYGTLEDVLLKTMEKQEDMLHEKKIEAEIKPSTSVVQEETKISRNSHIPKTLAEENLGDILNMSRKFSFMLNRWEVHPREKNSIVSFSSRNPKFYEDNPMKSSDNASNILNLKSSKSSINKSDFTYKKLKSVFVEKDYNSFLNLKLNGFKEYNSKKSPYLQQDKKSKVEVFSYLFDQNLSKTKTKKVMQLRLQKIANAIRKNHLKANIFDEDASLKKQKQGNSTEHNLEESFKKKEKFLNMVRQKINKAFNEESRLFNMNRHHSVMCLSP